MPTYVVIGNANVEVQVTLEADSEDEALLLAEEICPELTAYYGNGGVDKLVGVDQSNVSLEPYGVDFTIVMEE